ncbi:hypothetical protein M2267_002671 [Ensifer sp. KUDG1]|uniref:hypothetical protein n=1 Tax=Ensifer sp. KUDG1 TaxID=3373919 RepID=UPI003D1CCF80
MPVTMLLKDYHQAFGDRFRQLAAARSGRSVFAIEHGLEVAALAIVRRQVARQLEIDPDLGSVSWGFCYLPLIVVASEVGYRYRGTGTDFWPLLAQDLNLDPRSIPPVHLSRLFELSHRTYGLARPGDSAWEQHFPHIAWPIGNAAVPLEVQGPLAHALRAAVRAGISYESKDSLLDYVRNIASGQSGRRFENWLKRSDLSGEVMTRLLDPAADGWLTETFVRRVDADVRRDVESRRAIGEARRLTSRRSGRQANIPASRFSIALDGDLVTRISVRGPTLTAELRDQVISTLRIQRDVLGTATSREFIQLRLFLAGGELDLGMTADWPEMPLRRGDGITNTSPQSTLLLERLQPDEAELFQLEADGRSAVALLPSEQVAQGAIIVRIRGEGEGLSVIQRLDASSARDVEILRKHGFPVREGRSMTRLSGLPMPGTGVQFSTGFPILALMAFDETVLVLDQKSAAQGHLEIAGFDWTVFEPEAGEHTIGPEGFDEASHTPFRMVDPPEIEAASISIHPKNATLTDLMDGTLEVRIRAPLPLENVHAQIKLVMAGEEDLVTEGNVDRLPAHIGGRMPLLQGLKTSLAKRGAVPATAARLQVSVKGLLAEQFLLLPSRQLFQYDERRRSWTARQGSEGELVSRVATFSNLLPSKSTAASAECTLVLPDSEAWGALGAGRIVREKNLLRLGQGTCEQPSLPRTVREALSRGGSPGLFEMASAYLAWRLAEASDPIANWQQRQAAHSLEAGLVDLLCGENWRRTEHGLNLSVLSPAGAFRISAQRLGLLSGDDLPPIARSFDMDFLTRRITLRLHQAVPDHEIALAGWNEDLGGELDLAVIEAYEDLRSHMLQEGRDAFEEVDMQRPASTWLLALERARDIPRLAMFRRFILPEARWEALSAFPYETTTEDDIVDLLDNCHVDAFRRPGLRWIGRPELRAMLELWISPRALLEAGEWQQYLAKSLSDMQTARAVRYAALRRKLSRLDFPEESLA